MGGATIAFEPGLASIIGMQSVIDRLTVGAVAPFVAARAGELMARPPSGVLVYGAPGCGVRTITRAVASELAPFGAHDAVALDEATAPPDRVPWGAEVLIGWSHAPWRLSPTMFEPGRFELLVFVPPPDWEARRFRVWELAARSGFPLDDLDELVVATEGWSGVDLQRLSDRGGGVGDLVSNASQTRPSTWDWLLEARAALVDGPLSRGTEDLRIHLDRYRLT